MKPPLVHTLWARIMSTNRFREMLDCTAISAKDAPMFMLKKLISAFLLPMPIVVGPLGVGLALLWFTRRQKAGKIVTSVGFGLLFLMSYGVITNLLVVPLENDFHPLLVPGIKPDASDERAKEARWIIVLGGGHAYDKRLPPNSEL